MSDQHINCSECGGSFVFTESERQFYETKGLSGPPKRCKTCRLARKAADPGRSGGFRPGGRDGGPPPRGPREGGFAGRGGFDRPRGLAGASHGTGGGPNAAPVPRGGWGRMGGDAPRGPSRDAAGGGFRGRSEGGFTRSAGPGARTGAPGFGAPPRVGQDRGGATERPRFGENAVRPERPRYGDAAPRAERPRFGEGAARSDRPRYGDAAARADRPRFGDARREPRNDARAEPRKAPDPSRSGSAAPADQGNPKPNAQPSTRAKKPKTERPKFDVTCMQCGTAAQVPFRPIEGRDVFCQPCYQARRGPAPAGPGAPSTEPSPDAAPTAEVAARGDTSHAHERAPDGPVGLEASAPDDGDAVEHADPTSTPASGSSPAS